MKIIANILITLAVLIFLALIPYLEINASHVFNADWPAHARFHEVWQLSTNCAIGLLCLWLAWVKHEIPMASLLITVVMGGVLMAHAIEASYGGTILSGNSNVAVLGIAIAAVAAGLAILLAVGAVVLHWRIKKN